MRETYLGIDPGISGAVAIYRPKISKMWVYDMPVSTRKSGRKEIDAEAFAGIIDMFSEIKIAVIEEVGAMTYVDQYGQRRGQGAASSFAFGKSYGVVLGVLIGLMIPVAPVQPAVWKSLMGLNRDKNLSRLRAMNMFPDLKDSFARKKDDGRAEAALLAHFAVGRFK